MNRTALAVVAIATLSFAAPAVLFASEPAPPPPGLNDKGVQTAPTAVDATPAATKGDSETLKPTMPDTRLVRDKGSRSNDRSAAQIEATSDSVTERKEGSDTVREYREKGKLRMVRIVPQSGPTQTYYDRNGDGRLNKDSFEGPVSPVYFTLYEWD